MRREQSLGLMKSPHITKLIFFPVIKADRVLLLPQRELDQYLASLAHVPAVLQAAKWQRDGGAVMDVLQKALECKKMGEEESNSMLHSTTQQRLLTWWCSWGCQPTSDGDGLDGYTELFSVHSAPWGQLKLWGLRSCVTASAVSPLQKGPRWQNSPPAQVVLPAAAVECLLLQGITRHKSGDSLTGDGSCGKLQSTDLFFNKLSISWVCVLRRHFYAYMQIVCATLQEFIY